MAGCDSSHLMVPLPDPGAPMMRVLALFPLEKFLEKVTATTDLVAVLASRLDSRLLVNMISGNTGLKYKVISGCAKEKSIDRVSSLLSKGTIQVCKRKFRFGFGAMYDWCGVYSLAGV